MRLTILMDCWYACAAILNRIAQSGWTYVVALRSNRIVRFKGKKRILRNLVKGRRKSAFRTVKISRGRRVRFAVLEIHLPGVGPVRLAICRIGKTAWHYLVTNDLAMKGRQIVLQYLEWSWIETLHRETKQHLGFGETFMRRWDAIQKHWNLMVIAYNLVVLSRAARGCKGFRAKLEAYKASSCPQETIHSLMRLASV